MSKRKDMPWYQRDPKAALDGMRELSLEARGAYNTILDLIYLTGNRLHDDDRFVAGWCGVDIRVYRRLKTLLITCGKLRIEGGFIRNERADMTIDNWLTKTVAKGVAKP